MLELIGALVGMVVTGLFVIYNVSLLIILCIIVVLGVGLWWLVEYN